MAVTPTPNTFRDSAADPLVEVTTRGGHTYLCEPAGVEGWFLTSYEDQFDGTKFIAVKQYGQSFTWAAAVKYDRASHDGIPTPAIVNLMVGGLGRLQPWEARLAAELMRLAADFAAALNEAHEVLWDAERTRREERERKERERAEQFRKERLERQTREREERAQAQAVVNKWAEEMQEALQWHVGERLRLIRWGKKATVFGTLDDVSLSERPDYYGKRRGHLAITTEKGKSMRLSFDEIERLQLRDDDTRAYTDVALPDHPTYDTPPAGDGDLPGYYRRTHRDANGRRIRREIAGGSAKPITIVDGD